MTTMRGAHLGSVKLENDASTYQNQTLEGGNISKVFDTSSSLSARNYPVTLINDLEYDVKLLTEKPLQLEAQYNKMKQLMSKKIIKIETFINEMKKHREDLLYKQIKLAVVGILGQGKSYVVNKFCTGFEGKGKIPLLSCGGGRSVTNNVVMVEWGEQFSVVPVFCSDEQAKSRLSITEENPCINLSKIRRNRDLLGEVKLDDRQLKEYQKICAEDYTDHGDNMYSKSNVESIRMSSNLDMNPFPGLNPVHVERMQMARYIIENIEDFLEEPERISLEYIRLTGPFPQLNKNYILIDTPGIDDNSDIVNEKLVNVLKENVDAIMIVSKRVATSFLLHQVLKKYPAINDIHNIPVIISAYPENNHISNWFDIDSMELTKSVTGLADEGGIFDDDLFAQHLVYTELQKRKLLCPIETTTHSPINLKNFFDKCTHNVQIKKCELLSLTISSVLAICKLRLKNEYSKNDIKNILSKSETLALANWKLKKTELEKNQRIGKMLDIMLNKINLLDNSCVKSMQRWMLHLVKYRATQLLNMTKEQYVRVFVENFSNAYTDNSLNQNNVDKTLTNEQILHSGQDVKEALESFWTRSWTRLRDGVLFRLFATPTQDLVLRLKKVIIRFQEEYMNALKNELISIEDEDEMTKRKLALRREMEGDQIWNIMEKELTYLQTQIIDECSEFLNTINESETNRSNTDELLEWFENEYTAWKRMQTVNFHKRNPHFKDFKATAGHAYSNLPNARKIIDVIHSTYLSSQKCEMEFRKSTLQKRKELTKQKTKEKELKLYEKEFPMRKVKTVILESENDVIIEVEISKACEVLLKLPKDTLHAINQFSSKLQRFNLEKPVCVAPIFILSWVEDGGELSNLQFLNYKYSTEEEAKERYIIFIIVDPHKLPLYFDYLQNMAKTNSSHVKMFIIKLPEDNLTISYRLDICKLIAEHFDFAFWVNLSHNIHQMSELHMQLLKTRACSLGRVICYGQQVYYSLEREYAKEMSLYCNRNGTELMMNILKEFNLQQSPGGMEMCKSVIETVEKLRALSIRPKDLPGTPGSSHASSSSTAPTANELIKLKDIEKLLRYLPPAPGFEQSEATYNIVRKIHFITFAQSRYLLPLITATYPECYEIAKTWNQIHDCIINVTHNQRGIYNVPDNVFFKSKKNSQREITQQFDNLEAFDESVKKAVKNFHHKVYKDHRFFGLRFANFGFSYKQVPLSLSTSGSTITGITSTSTGTGTGTSTSLTTRDNSNLDTPLAGAGSHVELLKSEVLKRGLVEVKQEVADDEDVEPRAKIQRTN